MKKLFITAAIATMFSVTAFAKTTTTTFTGEENISYSVLNHFRADFNEAKNPAWTLTANCQKVSFDYKGAKLTAFYDLAGAYLGVTQDVDFKEIPADLQKEVTAKYSTYAVNEVIKFETDGSNTDINPLVYFVDLKKADSEVIVRATPGEGLSFYKKVK
jgi:hypothetical protein